MGVNYYCRVSAVEDSRVEEREVWTMYRMVINGWSGWYGWNGLYCRYGYPVLNRVSGFSEPGTVALLADATNHIICSRRTTILYLLFVG